MILKPICQHVNCEHAAMVICPRCHKSICFTHCLAESHSAQDATALCMECVVDQKELNQGTVQSLPLPKQEEDGGMFTDLDRQWLCSLKITLDDGDGR